jgi:HEAT repeat protein
VGVEGLVMVGIAAVLVVESWISEARKVRRIREVWLNAAREAGVSEVSFTGVTSPRMVGRTTDGMKFSVYCQRSNNTNQTSLRLQAPGVLPDFLQLRPESIMTAIAKRFDGPDIETGDRVFDKQVSIHGKHLPLIAVFDRATRTAVLELLKADGVVGSDEVIVKIRGNATDGWELSQAMRRQLALVRRLREPDDTVPPLAENALNDPHPGVRRRNLDVLAESFPHRDETATTLRAALADSDPAVRLAAARRLGPEGEPVLAALALAHGTPESIALDAIQVAGAALGSERAGALLTRGIGERRTELALAAVEALARCGDEEAAALLAPLLAIPDSRLAAAAAVALARCRGADAEPELIAALAREPRELRLAAATALAEIGTVNAVPALRAAVAAHPTEISFRRAVAKAVGAIQARALGAAPGQLSLATGATGQLALADDDGGRLSFAEDQSDAERHEP